MRGSRHNKSTDRKSTRLNSSHLGISYAASLAFPPFPYTTLFRSLPETAGRFELNATLDFRFGSRPAEVDLLCREPRIALEIDGYFHFQNAEVAVDLQGNAWLTAQQVHRSEEHTSELQSLRHLVCRVTCFSSFSLHDALPIFARDCRSI